jgi:hypothetical protein
VPSIYFTYDSRTTEFAETFAIPSFNVFAGRPFRLEEYWDQLLFESAPIIFMGRHTQQAAGPCRQQGLNPEPIVHDERICALKPRAGDGAVNPEAIKGRPPQKSIVGARGDQRNLATRQACRPGRRIGNCHVATKIAARDDLWVWFDCEHVVRLRRRRFCL